MHVIGIQIKFKCLDYNIVFEYFIGLEFTKLVLFILKIEFDIFLCREQTAHLAAIKLITKLLQSFMLIKLYPLQRSQNFACS